MNTQTDIIEADEAPAAKRDKGFTLVELLIVIVILGVLSTVTVFAVSGITDRGRTARCDSDQRTVEVAVESFYAENNAYPAGVDNNADGDFIDAGESTPMQALVDDGYLRDPSTLHTVGTGGTVTAIGDCA